MAKSQTTWTGGTKNTDKWVTVGKNGSQWNNETTLPASWAYNAAGVTYDQLLYTYNYVSVPPGNQSNSKSNTPWSTP